MQLPPRICPCICRGPLHIVERCAALYLAQVGGFEPPRLTGQKGDRPRAILGGIARKSSQLPEHLRMKPEGGVVTTRAGIAFAECVTVALPTEHISPELSPGIYIQYIIKNGVRRIHIDVLHFFISLRTLSFSRGTKLASRGSIHKNQPASLECTEF